MFLIFFFFSPLCACCTKDSDEITESLMTFSKLFSHVNSPTSGCGVHMCILNHVCLFFFILERTVLLDKNTYFDFMNDNWCHLESFGSIVVAVFFLLPFSPFRLPFKKNEHCFFLFSIFGLLNVLLNCSASYTAYTHLHPH